VTHPSVVAETPSVRTVVLGVDRISCPSGQAVLESALGRRPGVVQVTTNWATQTAAIRFDPAV